MGKNKRYNSGLYTFLKQKGLLNSGNKEEIKEAKRIYWLEYKKKWNRENRTEGKSFSIYFKVNEAKAIKIAAGYNKTSCTQFIKQSALSVTGEKIISLELIGTIREILILNYNTMQSFLERQSITLETSIHILSYIENLESEIMRAISKGQTKTKNKF